MLWQYVWLCKAHSAWSWQLHQALVGTVVGSISGDFIGEMLCHVWSNSRIFRPVSVIPPFVLWTAREMSMGQRDLPKAKLPVCNLQGAIIHGGGRIAVHHISSWLISETLHYWKAEGSRRDCFKTIPAPLPKPESGRHRMRQHLAYRAAEVHRNKLPAQTIWKKAGCWRIFWGCISANETKPCSSFKTAYLGFQVFLWYQAWFWYQCCLGKQGKGCPWVNSYHCWADPGSSLLGKAIHWGLLGCAAGGRDLISGTPIEETRLMPLCQS